MILISCNTLARPKIHPLSRGSNLNRTFHVLPGPDIPHVTNTHALGPSPVACPWAMMMCKSSWEPQRVQAPAGRHGWITPFGQSGHARDRVGAGAQGGIDGVLRIAGLSDARVRRWRCL